MGKALTAMAVENAKGGSARREIPDGLVVGLYLVVQPSGERSWACRFRIGGKPRKHTLGRYPAVDLRTARELAKQALLEVAKGGDPGAAKKAAGASRPTEVVNTVRDVAATFVERYAKPNTRAATARETERLLQREVIAVWGDRPLASVTRADVHALLDGIVDRGSRVTANRALAALRKMCGWAVDRGLLLASPCEKVRAPSAERSRDRVLSDDELGRAWQAFGQLRYPFGPILKLLALTGQRREEVAQLRWSELDLSAKLWTLPAERAKNGQVHTVPLSDPVVAILTDLPRLGDFVFSTTGTSPVSGFSKAKRRVDELMGGGEIVEKATPIPPWVIHDLRRTAASGMARLGVALPVIERILNHVSGSFGGIVGVYQRHSFAEEKRAALASWAAHVIGRGTTPA